MTTNRDATPCRPTAGTAALVPAAKCRNSCGQRLTLQSSAGILA